VTARRIEKRLAADGAATTLIPRRPDLGGKPSGGAPRLARTLEIERTWTTDRAAMAAALRVVLGLPKILPRRGGQEPR
jgi:hypothetical protein